jgi:hypothetical protein
MLSHFFVIAWKGLGCSQCLEFSNFDRIIGVPTCLIINKEISLSLHFKSILGIVLCYIAHKHVVCSFNFKAVVLISHAHIFHEQIVIATNGGVGVVLGTFAMIYLDPFLGTAGSVVVGDNVSVAANSDAGSGTGYHVANNSVFASCKRNGTVFIGFVVLGINAITIGVVNFVAPGTKKSAVR